MRKILVVITFAIVMAGQTALALAAEKQTFAAPTINVGDSWAFKRGDRRTYTLTVVEVSDNGFVTTGTMWPGLRFHLDRDGNIAKIEGEPSKVGRLAFLANGWKWLQFPLHVGKKWRFEAQGSRSHFTIDVKVKKLTKVKTKAGKFEALRLDACWSNDDSGWYSCGYRYWYAPKLKHIVKRTAPGDWAQRMTDSDYQLTSYTLNGQ